MKSKIKIIHITTPIFHVDHKKYEVETSIYDSFNDFIIYLNNLEKETGMITCYLYSVTNITGGKLFITPDGEESLLLITYKILFNGE